MRREHLMPFGTVLRDGAVHFRLWAPDACRVELSVQRQPWQDMARDDEGWYRLSRREAVPGSRYRFRIDDHTQVPDPASRYNPEDVHGPSEVIDPRAYDWQDADWRGRPWADAVIYELHVGSFSERGDFAGVEERLDALAELGVTAVELMPVADFPGARNWGYDGVLPYAPDARYGRPEALKRLVDAAHARHLMVFLDVVYNHFGPEGNYLHVYARRFFTERHQTPWGAGLNFDGEHSRVVRDFFIHNALYWLEEYHLDGLRLDAVHAIRDDSEPDIVEELGRAVRERLGDARHVHLILENDANTARYLRGPYTAQWNDDIHHAFHVLLTGEADGYYADYADTPRARLGRCLAEGYAYQGEPSRFRGGERRGESSGDLPATAFIAFLQNHDQVGNRALGERLAELAPAPARRAGLAMLLLSPNPPLLFMGDEWGSGQRFPFFCDFGPELARAVTEGRRREFAAFERFLDPRAREAIPDPSDPATFEAARLDWHQRERPPHADWLAYCRELLALRHRELVPRLTGLPGGQAAWQLLGEQGLMVRWVLGDGSRYTLRANLSGQPLTMEPAPGRLIHATSSADADVMPPWSVIWRLEEVHA